MVWYHRIVPFNFFAGFVALTIAALELYPWHPVASAQLSALQSRQGALQRRIEALTADLQACIEQPSATGAAAHDKESSK